MIESKKVEKGVSKAIQKVMNTELQAYLAENYCGDPVHAWQYIVENYGPSHTTTATTTAKLQKLLDFKMANEESFSTCS